MTYPEQKGLPEVARNLAKLRTRQSEVFTYRESDESTQRSEAVKVARSRSFGKLRTTTIHLEDQGFKATTCINRCFQQHFRIQDLHPGTIPGRNIPFEHKCTAKSDQEELIFMILVSIAEGHSKFCINDVLPCSTHAAPIPIHSTKVPSFNVIFSHPPARIRPTRLAFPYPNVPHPPVGQPCVAMRCNALQLHRRSGSPMPTLSCPQQKKRQRCNPHA